MKSFVIVLSFLVVLSCNQPPNIEEIKSEIMQTEKAFEKMTLDSGIPEAFYFYADENAVIKRGNDSIISGKLAIKNYYQKQNLQHATVQWAPDFIDVSVHGDMAYSYGKYLWRIKLNDSTNTHFEGVYLTVWKRQKDNSWKYVWD